MILVFKLFCDLEKEASIFKEKKLQFVVIIDQQRTSILTHKVNQFCCKANLWERSGDWEVWELLSN